MTTPTPDAHNTPEQARPALSEQIAALLAVPGGRTAIAAQRIAAPGRPAAATPQRATSGHDDAEHDAHDTHTHRSPMPPAEHAIALRAEEVFPAASLAKLCIAIELVRRVDLGHYSLSERFDTSTEPRVGGGGVLDYLNPSTQLTLSDLCFLMLGVSDNSAANFLLDLLGMGEINETLNRLNLSKTRLARHFMDWAARAARRDNVTSASDMLTLLTLLQGNALPRAKLLRDMLSAQQCSDDIPAWLPAHALLAHKSGSLDDTFHDTGMLTGPAGTCVFCVLTTEQRDLPAARAAVGHVVRALWETWCAGS